MNEVTLLETKIESLKKEIENNPDYSQNIKESIIDDINYYKNRLRQLFDQWKSIMSFSSEQFYELWFKFANSEIIKELPNDIEEFCKLHEITVDYFLQEFLWHLIELPRC